jgi:hypothetical protein
MWVCILIWTGDAMFGFGRKKKVADSNGEKDRQVSAPSSGIKGSLISLEQRLMFDAAASATASEVASEQVAQEQAEAAVSSDNHAAGPSAEQAESQGVLDAIATYNPGESRSEVVFVDPTVPNYQDLLSGMNSNIEVIMLDGGQDGIEQMANALSGRTGIDAIHVISHGGAGELQLGTGVLNADSMSTQYADDLAVIQQSLSEQADILVYGCEFAQGEAGQAAADMLAELTGADVQASNDLTGSISLGGDWEFEVSTGTIETSVAISYDVQMNWAEVLGTETVKDTFSSESYSNNNGTQSWSTSWSETDANGGGASGGDVRVNSSQLRIDTDRVGNAASRGVNLSGATSATLTFSYNNTLTGSDRIEARISNDNGATYVSLTGGVFSGALKTGSGSASFDISAYASANTRIQFIVTGTGGSDRLYVDNVQVSYDTGAANSAPTISSNGGSATASVTATENNATVTTVTATDADAGQSLTYSIAGGADAAKFTINSTTGQLSFASTPNYEAPTDSGGNNVYDVTVQVSDGNGGTDTQAIAVTVANTNEGPTDLALSATTVAENATTGTVVGTVTGTDPDASDTKSYSLTDTAGGRFAINRTTGQLTVADGSLLNYESAASHTVTVQVTDSGGQSYSETFTINLTNVNEGPTGADATVTISEDTAHTLTTANFGFSDVDAGDSLSAVRIDSLPPAGSLTLSGVAVTAGQVVSVADITAGHLVFTPAADATGTGYASVTFSLRDSHNAYDAASNTLTVNVTAVNDAPIHTAGTVSNLTVSEDAGLASLGLGGVTYSPGGGADESGQTLTYAVTAIPSASVGDVFLADGTTRVTVGSYTLADIQGMQFKPAANASGVTAFQFNVYDSGGTANGGANTISQFILITVAAVNDAPTITSLSGDSLAYSEGDGAMVIEQGANALVADVDSTNLDTGTLTVSIPSGGDSAEDVLSIRNQGTGAGQIGVSGSTVTYGGVTIGTFTGGSSGSNLVITLNSSATPTAVTALVKNITYENTDTNAPTTGARTVRYVLTDGDGGTSANYDTTVNVTAVNDAPTDLALSATTVAENATTGTVVGTVSGTDPDASDTKSYSLTDTAGGRFAINRTTGQLTVADGSLLNYESAASHTVTVQVTDSGGQSYSETFTINLTNVNEGPTGADATDAPTEDTANILTTVNFGIRETNSIPNALSSGQSLLIEGEEEGFRLPDGLQKTIEIKTEVPMMADILTPGRNGPSAVSEKLSENVIATRETPQFAHPNENHGSNALRDSMVAQGAAIAEANRKDFLEPDDPIENGDESVALKMSAAVGLAGIGLQNSMRNKSRLSTFISRPASASNVPPNTTPQQSADDNRASDQGRSEHPQPAVEEAGQSET